MDISKFRGKAMLKTFSLRKAVMTLFCIFSLNVVFAKESNWQLNMFKGVTPISRDIYHLHMVAMLICTIIGLVVFGIMIYSLIHHRKSKGYKAAHFHDNTRLEIVWTIIPFLILIGLAFPATRVLIRLDNTDNAEVTIKVVGSQWKWEYYYLDEGIHFHSNLATSYQQIENKVQKDATYLLNVDNVVVVPVHKKIRFLVTASDVIHSWWVPKLGIKRDAIPGFMHEAWARIEKKGIYRGQCTELCGIGHGYMPIVVKAVSEEDYDKWVKETLEKQMNWQHQQVDFSAQKTMSRDELMSLGKEKYRMVCAACHKVDGTGMPPVYPALKGSSVAVGYPISRHINYILKGVPGSGMQGYETMLSNEEIAAIVTYERNAWENNTNDLVQPIDIAKQRLANQKDPKIVKKSKVGGLQ
jgi:cytochrome c oxidase subunit 2